MALFKCKMCGGDLEIADGLTIVECEYCGTKQTVPKSMDENMQNLFNRANTLRIKSEFDKAEKLYEKIIQVDTTQSEAYWGMILCKYGIEYVDDPATFKKIPTCHRASYDPIIADDDYKSAIENADMSQRAIYEAQAKEIDRIQKEILALAQKEETYDVFICYKETDADGRRTQDSVIANDIYYQLKQEGFKVFYAAITLEGKLGSAYEPIIFAALNSAKVMLSIGTKPEYFNAVWVKNEWSRFLKIIRNDRSKLLIPCYRDMDAYELPEEFAHLQAQDMAKIGFINDLVRGIKKVIKSDEPKATAAVKETVVSSTNTNVAPLLKRAFMFLEDGEWDSANEYCEKVLDIDPENAEAYLGKLMSGLRVKKQEFLKDQAEPFDHNNNYQKAIRFADEKLKNTLTGYIEHINTRNENARLDGIYTRAKNAMSDAFTERDFRAAAQLFETIREYQDAAAIADECYEKAEVARKNAILAAGEQEMRHDVIYNCEVAIKLFESISGWKDADEKVYACQKKIEELKAKAEADRLERERLAAIKRENTARRNKKIKKGIIILTPIICLIIAFIFILNLLIIPTMKYNDAVELFKSEQYEDAISVFEKLDGFKDSEEKIIECENGIIHQNNYNEAIALMNAGKYSEAINAFKALNGYRDSEAKISECNTAAILDIKYNEAKALMDAGKYSEAINAFKALNGYRDSEAKISECNTAILDIKYNEAKALMDAGKYSEAISAFEAMNGYKDSEAKISECNTAILDIKYNDAIALMDAGNIVEAYEALISLDGYKDSTDKASSIFGKYFAEKHENIKVGDNITFGVYEQDDNTSNGKEAIEWLVLDVKDGKALVISKYALDCKQYNTSYTDVTWETCTLRKWLNNDFLGAAFSADEKAMIPTVTVSADKNPKYSTNPGNATQDQVFLLSITEVNKYFSSDSARQCKPTDYAVANGAYVNSSNGNCWWWLRSPGYIQFSAAYVYYDGDVDEYGGYVYCDCAVRPALWIDLNS